MSTLHGDFAAEKYTALQKVVQHMETLGFFEAQPAPNEDENVNHNIFFHCDFEQRNILVLPSSGNVQTEGDRRWKVSAVIDWDDTLSLPPISTRKPPI
jgi:Ser/Thr protein kinase RdoA (MazF antagonist)